MPPQLPSTIIQSSLTTLYKQANMLGLHDVQGGIMRDLEELRSHIYAHDSKPYFDEGVRAYQAGAYRAAIVETWVAVSLDLISKIRHLAERGDKTAKSYIDKLDKAIKQDDKGNLQKVENELLDKAKTLELITGHEYTELQRLYLDRNVCAHPAFTAPNDVFQPTAEQVRYHLSSAVDNALSLPPTPGRLLSSQLINELKQKAWPKQAQLGRYFRENYLNAKPDRTRRNIAELLIKTAIETPELETVAEVEPEEVTQRCRNIINSLLHSEESLLQQSIKSVLRKRLEGNNFTDEVLLRTVGALGQFSSTWETLDSPTITRISSLISTSPIEELRKFGTLICHPIHHDEIEAAADDRRIELSESNEGYEYLFDNISSDATYRIRLILNALEKSKDFRNSERLLQDLISIGEDMKPEHLSRLAEITESNYQVYFAKDTENLLKSLYSKTKHIENYQRLWNTITDGIVSAVDAIPYDGYFSDYNYSSLQSLVNSDAES